MFLKMLEALINTLFFDEFSKAKSLMFLKRITENQKLIDMRLFKKTWRTLDCSPKNDEDYPGDSREPPLRWEEEGADNKEEGGDEVLVQQVGDDSEREAHCELLQESGSRNQRSS